MPSSAREVFIGLAAQVRMARSASIGAMVTTAAPRSSGAATAIMAESASTAKAHKRICDRVGGRTQAFFAGALSRARGAEKNEEQPADRARRVRNDCVHELRCVSVHPLHL